MQHALGVQLNIRDDHPFRWMILSDDPPTIDTSDQGKNIAVGRAYSRVRVPAVKLAAPVVEESVDFLTVRFVLL